VRAELERVEADARDPLTNEAAILTCREAIALATATSEQQLARLPARRSRRLIFRNRSAETLDRLAYGDATSGFRPRCDLRDHESQNKPSNYRDRFDLQSFLLLYLSERVVFRQGAAFDFGQGLERPQGRRQDRPRHAARRGFGHSATQRLSCIAGYALPTGVNHCTAAFAYRGGFALGQTRLSG
jgi:hypothetical protein